MMPIPVGDTACEIVVGDGAGDALGRIRALADALRADPPAGTVDVVPALDRVTVVYDIGRIASRDDFFAHVARIAGSAAGRRGPAEERVHEIPVCYGGDHGPDLADVCAAHGCDRGGLVRLHTRPLYRVQAVGFVPGFAYLAGLPPELATPRRATPRRGVPAGSVGIGGEQTGVYPCEVPGGWNIIGRSPLRLFDPGRQPAALMRTGDRVRFVEIGPREFAGSPPPERRQGLGAGAVGLTVVAPGLWTTIQDLGRPGHRAEGVPVAGAVDVPALRLANLLVGNPEGAAALECTLVGPTLHFDRDAVVAVAGADFPGLPCRRAVRIAAGSRILLGHARTGCRGYLAVAGGIDVAPELGSRSTYVPSLLGGLAGRPLAAGDRLPIGPCSSTAAAAADAADILRVAEERKRPCTLRIIPSAGAEAVDRAAWGREYRVSSRSDRMGVRLEGAAMRGPGGGASVPVVPGTVQLPPDGLPIVLLADAQTIGGYPVLGHVIAADLSLVAQLRPGEIVRWKPVTLEEAHDAFRAREGAFDRVRAALAGRSSS